MCYSYNTKINLILTFDYKCFSFLASIPSLILRIYTSNEIAILDSFVNWVSAIPPQRELWNYFQFNYTSVQNYFREALNAESVLWCPLY